MDHKDIIEEKMGAAHYRAQAKKNPKNKVTFESMAKDEDKHKKLLKEMVKNAKK